jgi:hypothetical protein
MQSAHRPAMAYMTKPRIAVPMIETTIDPKQPRRFEKKANMGGLI